MELVAVKKFQPTVLNSTANLRIKLSEPKMRTEGFLKHKFVTYQVQTFPLMYQVERKDKDFNFLWDLLAIKYPHVVVPACPEHQSQTKEDEIILQKKMELLETFMNSLIQNEELIANPSVLNFLSMPGQKEHSKQLKNEMQKATPPKTIYDYQTLSGVYDVSKNRKAEIFCNEINNFIKSNEQLFKRFNEVSRKLITDMMEVNKSVDDLSSICAKISQNYQIAECYDLEKSYEKIRVQLQSWASLVEKESKVVYNTFPKFFRYNMIENKSYLEIFKNRAELREKVKNNE